ncbi:ABC-three component system protein [Stenotrophomonas maltophilia]|uniref:ABC-three component system protein n=1 Tax=Stenotrophomonas maltophilia TaxID=40324 RepID=UPI000B516F69|nr:ABC-three component system protein [Stenotrophomonas maltophilia]ASE52066.1 hypothetical protein CEQ03_04475 [Stenotrophomonas maltophilia]HEL4827344.1 hypothetical protein [Stenotrophomonas maltophilia]HEL5083344.1 hypothetical protein [Stenotrophomonas maltophilia]HEL5362733.1 hypothetical protein [Stenotrophomonas maltophilia]
MTTGGQSASLFGAGDSALGYLYQIRLALLASLHRLARGQIFCVYLETLDDVTFEPLGSPLELFQLKHHIRSKANLTDASPDIWKTLRVWITGRSDGTIPLDARLCLVTTSSVVDHAIAAKLGLRDRDEASAIVSLSDVASTSTNAENAVAYGLYLSLSATEKLDLISSITIVPRVANIGEVEQGLSEYARTAVRRDVASSFLTRLEGWWLVQCQKHLIAQSMTPVTSAALESEIDDLRDQFLIDALPIDDDILEAEVELAAYDGAIFVHQAKLAGIGPRRVLAAVRDYYRAFEHRSRWMRENLLLVGELDKYERTLKEEWMLVFDRAVDEMGEHVAEVELTRAARAIYQWVETSCIPIRPRVGNPSLSRGSLHMLADKRALGWHPQFRERLEALLESSPAT